MNMLHPLVQRKCLSNSPPFVKRLTNGCILCFIASASEISPLWRAHLRLSAFICGCILCFSACASQTRVSSCGFRSLIVASSVSAQVVFETVLTVNRIKYKIQIK